MGEWWRNERFQAVMVVLLLCLSGVLLVTAVRRASHLRSLEVQVQAKRALRDSLDASNASLRLELIRWARPDRVYRELEAKGFQSPSPSQIRFVLYPGPVHAGNGALPPDLASLAGERRAQVTGTEPWLWSWVRRIPTLRAARGR